MHHLPYWRLSGFYFSYFAFTGVFSPYWSLYLKSLSFSAFQIGVLMSLLPIMRTFASAVWGTFADRSGKRMKIVRWSALLSLVSFAGVFAGNGFWWLFLAMALMSFFWSASLPLVEAATMSHLGEHIAGYGRIRLWGSVGFVVAVVGVGYVLDRVEVTVLLWVVLASKIGIAYFCRQIPEAATAAHHTDHQPVWHILRKPEVAFFLFACFLMAAAHGPYYTFFSIYLVDHGYAKSTVGWLWALGVICEIAIFIWLPRILHYVSLRRILIFSLGCTALRFLLIGWGVDAWPLILIAQALHAVTFGAYHAAAMAVVHHFFRGRHQTKGQAIYGSLSFGAGGMTGALLSGYLWDSVGAAWVFSACSVAALAGMLLLWWKLKLEPE